MDRNGVISALRANECELRRLGVLSLSLFGSIARGDGNDGSDIDIAIKLDPEKTPRGLQYLNCIDEIEERLKELLGRHVDVISEPARKPRFQEQIDRDRVLAF